MKPLHYITALLLACSGVLGASIDPLDLVVQADVTSGTIVMRTTVELPLVSEVVVEDEYGNPVIRKEVAGGEYLNLRFSHGSFPSGHYTIALTNERGRTEQPFLVTPATLVADAATASRVLYPVVRFDDDHRTLRLRYHTPNHSRIRLELSDPKGNALVKETVPGRGRAADPADANVVQRAYRLDNVPPGAYTMTVSDAALGSYRTTVHLD